MRKFILAAATLLLAACVSVLPDAPPASARYQVTDVAFDGADHAPVSWSLGVEEPEATLAYNSAKAAVWMMTKSIALHCARAGYDIRCNSVHPVFTRTAIIDPLIAMGGGGKD